MTFYNGFILRNYQQDLFLKIKKLYQNNISEEFLISNQFYILEN